LSDGTYLAASLLYLAMAIAGFAAALAIAGGSANG
jgi:hypothetical protein